MKKLDWKLIIIIVLAIIVVIEGIFLLKNNFNDKQLITKEKSLIYTNSNIVSKVSNDIDVDYSIYNNGKSLLLKLTSLEKNIMTSNINITFKNDDNKIIDTFTTPTGFLVKDDIYAVNVSVPTITDGYAGDIEITITPTYLDEETMFYDKSLIKLNHTEINNENNSITMNITGINPFEGDISMIQGLIILSNNQKIVQVANYSQNNITSGESININVSIPSGENGEVLAFDNVEIIINELY